MQYSLTTTSMYVSMVDAGTVEFLRSLGKEIVTSADLSASLKAVMTDEQRSSHQGPRSGPSIRLSRSVALRSAALRPALARQAE